MNKINRAINCKRKQMAILSKQKCNDIYELFKLPKSLRGYIIGFDLAAKSMI